MKKQNSFEREIRRNNSKKVFKITLEHHNYITGDAKYIAANSLQDAEYLAKKYAKDSYDSVGNRFAVTVRETDHGMVFEGTPSDVLNNKGKAVAIDKLFATNFVGNRFLNEIRVAMLDEEGVFAKRIYPLPILNLKGAYVDSYAQYFRYKI